MIAFTLSVALCAYAILGIYTKWQERPVILTFNDKTTSISTIPFPAVTICSTEKSTKQKVDMELLTNAMGDMIFRNDTSTFNNLTSDE